MKSFPLTGHTRESITRLLVERAFKDRVAALAIEERQIANRIYSFRYAFIASLMNALPPGVLPEAYKVKVWLKGVCGRHDFSFGENRRVSFNEYTQQDTKSLTIAATGVTDVERLLARDAKAFLDKKAHLEEERCQVKRKTEKVLAGVTTTKRLFEVWPECQSLVETSGIFYEKPKNQMTVVTAVIELNAALDLPPGGTAKPPLAKKTTRITRPHPLKRGT